MATGGTHYRCILPGAPVSPNKRIGGLYEKLPPCNKKPETRKEARARLEIEHLEREAHRKDVKGWVAWIVKLAAMGGFLVGGYIHLRNSGGVGKSLGSTIMGMSVLAYVFGVVIHFEMRFENLLEMLIVSVLIGLAVWRLYKWRNVDGTKRVKKALPISSIERVTT